MRPILLASIISMLSAETLANNIGIKEISHEGHKAFVLQVSATTQVSAAEKLRDYLISSQNYPVSIENPGNKGIYLVQVGPIDDIDAAHELQKSIDPKGVDSIPSVNDTISIIPPIKSTIDATKANPSSQTTLIQNQEGEQPTQRTQRLWNLRNADIRAVIAEVSRVTGKNFIIDPRVQGKISIISSSPMGGNELYQVFLAALQVSGFAAIPNGGIVKIVPNADAKTLSPDLLSTLKHPPKGDEMLVEVIPVHYVPAEQLVPVLRPLMPQWSSVSAYSPSNMLILSGRASNVRQMSHIIKQVDNSSVNGIDMIPIKHALAMDIASTLKTIVKSDRPGPNQVMVAADDRTNSILVSGSKTDRIKVRLIVAKLDSSKLSGPESNTQVIYLNYMRAEDLAPILAGIAQANFSGSVGTTIGTVTRPPLDSTNPASAMVNYNNSSPEQSSLSTGAQPNPQAAPTTSITAGQTEGNTKPQVQIIAEPNTNSIILNAPTTLIRTLRSVISQLDIKPAQLLIQALVVEINEADLESLGIEWGSLAQTKEASQFRPGFAILNSKTNLDDLQSQIYALATTHKANILSTPSVVVLDNRQAKILIGKQVSVASSNYPNNANGTAASGSPYTTFERVNVALHLYVRPQITRDKGIQMQIDQGNDTLDVINSATVSSTPTFNISSIVTSVHIESGDVIVLGGLAQDGLGEDNVDVPILGDIPGLGKLFQHNIKKRDKKVLMVFIRPQILRTDKDEREVSNRKYNSVRDEQLDFLQDFNYNAKNNQTLLPPIDHVALPEPFANYSDK